LGDKGPMCIIFLEKIWGIEKNVYYRHLELLYTNSPSTPIVS